MKTVKAYINPPLKMRKFFYLIALSIAMLSCKEIEPVHNLEGTWLLKNGTLPYVEYVFTDTRYYSHNYDFGGFYGTYEVVRDSLTFRNERTGETYKMKFQSLENGDYQIINPSFYARLTRTSINVNIEKLVNLDQNYIMEYEKQWKGRMIEFELNRSKEDVLE